MVNRAFYGFKNTTSHFWIGTYVCKGYLMMGYVSRGCQVALHEPWNDLVEGSMTNPSKKRSHTKRFHLIPSTPSLVRFRTQLLRLSVQHVCGSDVLVWETIVSTFCCIVCTFGIEPSGVTTTLFVLFQCTLIFVDPSKGLMSGKGCCDRSLKGCPPITLLYVKSFEGIEERDKRDWVLWPHNSWSQELGMDPSGCIFLWLITSRTSQLSDTRWRIGLHSHLPYTPIPRPCRRRRYKSQGYL